MAKKRNKVILAWTRDGNTKYVRYCIPAGDGSYDIGYTSDKFKACTFSKEQAEKIRAKDLNFTNIEL